MIKKKCNKIILGCTELPIAIFAFKSFKNVKSSKIFLDPNLILANSAEKIQKIMLNKEKPYVLLVAELIYKKIIDIKKNPDFSNINAIEAFIGSSTYLDISKGNFHDRLISKLSKNNFTKKSF